MIYQWMRSWYRSEKWEIYLSKWIHASLLVSFIRISLLFLFISLISFSIVVFFFFVEAFSDSIGTLLFIMNSSRIRIEEK